MTIVYLRTQNRLTCTWSAMRGGAVPGRTKSAGRSQSGTPIALRDDRQSQASRDIRLIEESVLGVTVWIVAFRGSGRPGSHIRCRPVWPGFRTTCLPAGTLPRCGS